MSERDRVQNIKQNHRDLVTGAKRERVHSPAQVAKYGKYLPGEMAAKSATRRARFSGSKPQTRDQAVSQRIGLRRIFRTK